MRCAPALSLCCLTLCLMAGRVQALDPSRHISQYGHAAWRLQDGYFGAIPTSIAQSKDGYLWIGTLGGLKRFDGVRFVQMPLPLPTKYLAVRSLAASEDSGIWIGLNSGLAHRSPGGSMNFLPTQGRVAAIEPDGNGKIWVARSHVGDDLGPLCEVAEQHFVCHGKADGISNPNALALARDSSGAFWIGGGDSLSRWQSGSAQGYPLQALDQAAGVRTPGSLNSGIQALAAAPDHSVWIGFDREGPGLGLQRLLNGKMTPLVTPTFDSSTLVAQALLFDHNHDLWVGTFNQGIYRIQGKRVEHFDSANGLSGDFINGFFEDREGNLWVATTRGLDSFHDLPVATFSKQEGLTADSAVSVLASSTGKIWIGNAGGLDSLENAEVSSVRWRHGLPGNQVGSMLEDSSGRLWIGIDSALYIYDRSRFTPVEAMHGGPIGTVVALAEDSNHDIWAKVLRDTAWLVRIESNKVVAESQPQHISVMHSIVADPHGGIWMDIEPGGLALFRDGQFDLSTLPATQRYPIYDIAVDADGSLWGATKSGALSVRQGVVHLLSEDNGLPCNAVFAAITDKHGALWLASTCGLVQISRKELERWWANPTTRVATRLFNAAQGALTGYPTFSPAATRSPDGRLWFTNDNQILMIDPDHLDLNPLPPPVQIEAMVANGNSIAQLSAAQLAPAIRDLEIDYTALSFVMPQYVRFRYQLQGHDLQWQDADTRRAAFYTNLAPGHYEFLLSACNSDGVCNENGTSLGFVIPPAWYQTWWFRLLCILSAASVCYFLYSLRMRQLKSLMEARFNERLNERTRIASALHDTLLQTIHATRFSADAARESTSDPPTRDLLDRISTWLGRASLEVRAALESLRTPTLDGGDLAASLRGVTEECGINHPLEVSLTITGKPRELTQPSKDEIYLIIYEAIRNAYNHSRGTRLALDIAYSRDLTVRVADNGRGTDPEFIRSGKPGHFGLRGMQERAKQIGATLSFGGSPDTGAGTVVTLTVPGRKVFEQSETSAFAWFRSDRATSGSSDPTSTRLTR